MPVSSVYLLVLHRNVFIYCEVSTHDPKNFHLVNIRPWWSAGQLKATGLGHGGADWRGSPDIVVSQERTSMQGVTVTGRRHNEDISLERRGASSLAHAGRHTQIDSHLLYIHITSGYSSLWSAAYSHYKAQNAALSDKSPVRLWEPEFDSLGKKDTTFPFPSPPATTVAEQ